jgi:hypothetical protein
MTNDPVNNIVAIYWDFENLHAALYDLEWAGSRSYIDPRNRYIPQEVLINVKAVMDYAASIGDVAVNRAYNNWQWFSRYRDAVNNAGIDLIQIYPKGALAKNGADIRLALDVFEDVSRNSKLTHVIIVSSDSDFISLAQKLKQSGLTVIGIGVQQATNRYWAQNCDEFRYYDTLLGLTEELETSRPAKAAEEEDEEPAVRPMSLDDAKALLLDALRRLAAQKGTDQVPRSSLKNMMKRMDSTFDESNFGFLSFGAFLKAFPDVVEDLPDASGGQVRLRSASKKAAAQSLPPQAASGVAEQDYEMLLKRGNVRLLPAPWWREAVPVVEQIFKEAPRGRLASFDDLQGKLSARLAADGLDGNPELVHKLRGFLFGLWQFSLSKEDKTISLKYPDLPLLKCVEREIVRRIAKSAAPPIDVGKVAAILYGDYARNKLKDVRKLVNSLTQERV